MTADSVAADSVGTDSVDTDSVDTDSVGTDSVGSDSFAEATAVADAVLYEGYLLYPYRASSDKNRMRFQFGVLVPPDAVESTAEEADTRTEFLCEPAAGATLRLRLRFLHLRSRRVEVADGAAVDGAAVDGAAVDGEAATDGAGYRAVDRLTVGGIEYTTWDEATEREIDALVPFDALLDGEIEVPFEVPATVEVESLRADGGIEVGRLVRRCAALLGLVRLSATPLYGPFGGARLRIDVHNTSEAATDESGSIPSGRIPSGGILLESGRDARDAALPRALIGAHTLLGLSEGAFISLIDPPEWARSATAECVNLRSWPVLVGDPGRRHTVLCAPIIVFSPVLVKDAFHGDASHFSIAGSVSGLIASAGHSGSHTPQSMHSSGWMTSMFSPS